jgi:hypothetical protein
MPEHQLNQQQYALQWVVKSFSILLFDSAEHDLTHTFCVVFLSRELESIDYLVLRYRNNGALPDEEFSEECKFHREV